MQQLLAFVRNPVVPIVHSMTLVAVLLGLAIVVVVDRLGGPPFSDVLKLEPLEHSK